MVSRAPTASRRAPREPRFSAAALAPKLHLSPRPPRSCRATRRAIPLGTSALRQARTSPSTRSAGLRVRWPQRQSTLIDSHAPGRRRLGGRCSPKVAVEPEPRRFHPVSTSPLSRMVEPLVSLSPTQLVGGRRAGAGRTLTARRRRPLPPGVASLRFWRGARERVPSTRRAGFKQSPRSQSASHAPRTSSRIRSSASSALRPPASRPARPRAAFSRRRCR